MKYYTEIYCSRGKNRRHLIELTVKRIEINITLMELMIRLPRDLFYYAISFYTPETPSSRCMNSFIIDLQMQDHYFEHFCHEIAENEEIDQEELFYMQLDLIHDLVRDRSPSEKAMVHHKLRQLLAISRGSIHPRKMIL